MCLHTHTHTHARTLKHLLNHTHIFASAHTHTHTHTHTHVTCWCAIHFHSFAQAISLHGNMYNVYIYREWFYKSGHKREGVSPQGFHYTSHLNSGHNVSCASSLIVQNFLILFSFSLLMLPLSDSYKSSYLTGTGSLSLIHI